MTAQDVVNAILGVSSNLEVRESMLLGSRLESGWSETAVGDQGTSFGPFQMHIGGALTAQGGTPADAENPTWAAQHMLGYYQSAVNNVPSSLWTSNPEMAAEEAAVGAEGPAQTYYQSQGTNAVNSAWAATQNALKGVVSAGGSPGGGTGGGTTTTSANDPFPGGNWDPLNWPFSVGQSAVNSITGAIDSAAKKIAADFWAKIKPLMIRLGLILLGAFIIYAGINGLLKEGQGPTQIVTSGAQSATKRVKAAGS